MQAWLSLMRSYRAVRGVEILGNQGVRGRGPLRSATGSASRYIPAPQDWERYGIQKPRIRKLAKSRVSSWQPISCWGHIQVLVDISGLRSAKLPQI